MYLIDFFLQKQQKEYLIVREINGLTKKNLDTTYKNKNKNVLFILLYPLQPHIDQ